MICQAQIVHNHEQELSSRNFGNLLKSMQAGKKKYLHKWTTIIRILEIEKKNFLNLYNKNEYEKEHYGPAISNKAEFAITKNRNNKNTCNHVKNFLKNRTHKLQTEPCEVKIKYEIKKWKYLLEIFGRKIEFF